MIAKYLATLPDDALDRIITRTMRPGNYGRLENHGPCLVGTALDIGDWDMDDAIPAGRAIELSCLQRDAQTRQREERFPKLCAAVETQYDDLCSRFGVARTNNAIRDRAIRVLASRQPAPAPQPMMAEVNG